MNNVDIRYNFLLGGNRTNIIVASNRSLNSLSVYRINTETRALENIAARTISTNIDVYGFCMYRSPITGRYYSFVNATSGLVQQWEMVATADGKVDATMVRSFDVGGQVEGCVADDETGAFYVGEEAVGIWRYSAEPGGGTARTRIDSTGSGGNLTADIEGLSIYYASNGNGYLLASNQGDNSYVVYDRKTGGYITKFKIIANGTIDGTNDTDGIDVLSFGLGSLFPYGVFIAQDGTNSGGNQNYKLVPWERIAHSIAMPLLKEPSAKDPRLVGAN